MAEILMSIHGKYADMIFSGEKTVELRKTAPVSTNDEITVYLYNTDTKGVSGRMTVAEVRELTEITESLADSAGLSVEEILEYKGEGRLYGWFIECADYFDEDWLRLGDFGVKRAPQSWQYIRR